MPTYITPIKDIMYNLTDVLNIEQYQSFPGFEDATEDLFKAILEESGKLCEEVLLPLNTIGDIEGCTRHKDGSVTTPKGFKEAYKLYCEGGWLGISQDPKYGGQGLPYIVTILLEELLASANMSFNMYPGLTGGAASAINVAGNDKQREKYLPNLHSGKWTGTMCLTEAHCGTDLGLMRSKAELQENGIYKVTGSKIFITGGEHDLTENIIHLVLAKIPGGPEGSKGISLFIVPKIMINDDGSLGEKNGVMCGSIEEKMGIHGASTCVMNFDGATGYLLGAEHDGLKAMFIMMNGARIGVGIQGLAQSEVSYQNAANYARERLQMRSISGTKNPDGPADPIIVHPDIRRMLMDARAFNEGARSLAMWVSLLPNFVKGEVDEKKREEYNDLLGLLTPVMKGYFTDKGYENATNAQQIFGGHGYIKEYGMDQFVRDARIAMIYEGTNGIQALDLVGRKLGANGGRAIQSYFALLTKDIEENEDPTSDEFIKPLKAALGDLQSASIWLLQNATKNPDNAGAASYAYMHLLGLVALGHMWLKMAIKSSKVLKEGSNDPSFHENKLITARYFMKRMLPETGSYLKKIEVGADTMMTLDANAF